MFLAGQKKIGLKASLETNEETGMKKEERKLQGDEPLALAVAAAER